MAFESFPSHLFCKVLETSETFLCGAIAVPDSQELRHIVLTLFKNGTAAGTERLRLRLYHDLAMEKLYSTSDWYTVEDSAGEAERWIGRIRFDFPYPNLAADQTYYVVLDADGYARDGDTFYLSFVTDWPIATYELAATMPGPLAMAVFGRRRVPSA